MALNVSVVLLVALRCARHRDRRNRDPARGVLPLILAGAGRALAMARRLRDAGQPALAVTVVPFGRIAVPRVLLAPSQGDGRGDAGVLAGARAGRRVARSS